MNKKGAFIPDLIFIMAFLLAAVIVFMVVFRIYLAWEENNRLDSPTAKSITAKGKDTLANLDVIFGILLIGFAIGLVVSMFLIKSHPIFFVASLIGLIIVVVLSAQLSNVHEKFAQSPQMIDVTDTFDISDRIMSNLPTFLLFLAAIAGIVLWAKAGGRGS